jgi:hypothetical protein
MPTAVDSGQGTMPVVSFFDIPASDVPAYEEPEPQRVPWHGASDDTIGVVVPLVRVLAWTEDVAIIVSDLVAYPSGFDLTVVTIARRVATGRGMSRNPMGFGFPDRAYPSPEFLRFGLRFSDGTKASNVGFGQGMHPAHEGVRDLLPGGSGGGGRKYSARFWCEPLPPPGSMGLVCEWPKYGIAEIEEVISADLILDAAAQAKPIWPEDVGIPEPPGISISRGRHAAPGYSSTVVSTKSDS